MGNCPAHDFHVVNCCADYSVKFCEIQMFALTMCNFATFLFQAA